MVEFGIQQFANGSNTLRRITKLVNQSFKYQYCQPRDGISTMDDYPAIRDWVRHRHTDLRLS